LKQASNIKDAMTLLNQCEAAVH